MVTACQLGWSYGDRTQLRDRYGAVTKRALAVVTPAPQRVVAAYPAGMPVAGGDDFQLERFPTCTGLNRVVVVPSPAAAVGTPAPQHVVTADATRITSPGSDGLPLGRSHPDRTEPGCCGAVTEGSTAVVSPAPQRVVTPDPAGMPAAGDDRLPVGASPPPGQDCRRRCRCRHRARRRSSNPSTTSSCRIGSHRSGRYLRRASSSRTWFLPAQASAVALWCRHRAVHCGCRPSSRMCSHSLPSPRPPSPRLSEGCDPHRQSCSSLDPRAPFAIPDSSIARNSARRRRSRTSDRSPRFEVLPDA